MADMIEVMNLAQDVLPLTEFREKSKHFVAQLEETRRPLILTVNGRAKLVVMDVQVYQELIDRKAKTVR